MQRSENPMSTSIFSIKTYKIDEGLAMGHYEANSELEKDLRAALKAVGFAKPRTVGIPFIDGATLTGHRKGNGFMLSARLDVPNCEDVEAHVHLYMALDNDSAEAVVNDATKVAKDYRWMEFGIHPDWSQSMSEVPDAPFTILIPNRLGLERMVAGNHAFRQLDLLTGFLQSMVGQALLDTGFEPIDYIEGSDDFHGQNMIAAVQTGGELPDRLIVLPGEDGFPEVRAHIVDVEMDVFTVNFHSDGTMDIGTEDIGYLMLSRNILLQLLEFEEQAQQVWNEVDSLNSEREEHLDDPSSPDPLKHLYTEDNKIDLPEGFAEEVSKFIGVPNRTEN